MTSLNHNCSHIGPYLQIQWYQGLGLQCMNMMEGTQVKLYQRVPEPTLTALPFPQAPSVSATTSWAIATNSPSTACLRP